MSTSSSKCARSLGSAGCAGGVGTLHPLARPKGGPSGTPDPTGGPSIFNTNVLVDGPCVCLVADEHKRVHESQTR